jgi:hypothetical protein
MGKAAIFGGVLHGVDLETAQQDQTDSGLWDYQRSGEWGGRGECAIENRDHYVRDVTLGEGRCRVRNGSFPSVLAVMRSHAIGALRLLGIPNIAEGTRWG